MSWYSKSVKETQQLLETNQVYGLTEQEAQNRLEKMGENQLSEGNGKKSFFSRFLAQLNDFMVIVLIAAAAASFFISYLQGERDFLDSAIILAIVFLNALMGVIQEDKAEKAIEALKEMAVPSARVLREGKICEIEAKYVVPGDILILEAGDYVCADGRLTETKNLKAEESALTGESVPVEKNVTKQYDENTPVGDRKNMVFSSTYITYGRGKAIVTETGMNTEVGKIAGLMLDTDTQETPLQKRLAKTGKLLGIAALAICLVIFCMGLLRHADPFEMFMTSVSLAVAAIPEGLPAIVTIVLAIGMQRMSRKNTIIRRLPAVETLGSAQVICSDKTGTLTQNKMKVVKVADGQAFCQPEEESRRNILMLSALCNDSRWENGMILGEPTETALVEAAKEAGLRKNKLEEAMPRVDEIPFSSERKRMTTVHKVGEKGYLSVTKGAPEILLPRCQYRFVQGKILPFTEEAKRKAQQQNNQMAEAALRVIAVAYRQLDEKPPMKEDTLENEMIFAGFIGMIDPPRPEAAEAVRVCRKAGIKPVMITGDNVLTALAIGRELGIYEDGDKYMTGRQLEKISDEDLRAVIEKCSIFARVSPAHKVRIVDAFKQNGKVVAMTGDGVNDAPALKAADIGCAMGKNGTDVAKGAADMIILDDNFATIVTAVQEGRGIYANIKKSVHFLLSSNIGEILAIFLAMVFGWGTPLLPIQLLWVNLVTDSLPAVALGLDPADKNIMNRKPQPANDSVFSNGRGVRIALEGCMIGILCLLAFGIGHIYFDKEAGYGVGRTMAFAVLSLSELIHAFNMRSDQSVFTSRVFDNKFLLGAFFLGVLLQAGVIMIEPFARLFLVTPLNFRQWMIVAGLSLIPVLLVETEKLLGIGGEYEV